MRVAKIRSGMPSPSPRATAELLTAAVSAHRAVSSAQHGPVTRKPIRIRCGRMLCHRPRSRRAARALPSWLLHEGAPRPG